MTKKNVAVAFRWPRFPVIVANPARLTAALERRKLLAVLGAIESTESKFEVKVIDAAGREFWYSSTQRILAPGFTTKVWTKLQLVHLYNDGRGANRAPYLPGSLPNRRLERIVREIAHLLVSAESTSESTRKTE